MTHKYIQLKVGTRFGRLTVISSVFKRLDKKTNWFCRCDCGVERYFRSCSLRKGKVTSCGCFAKELAKNRAFSQRKYDISTGTLSGKRTYASWRLIYERCYNPEHIKFKSYGLKGIKVCERWRDFNNFLQDMGLRPEGTIIGRIDNSGDYEPGNCRWEMPTQQANNRSCTVFIEGIPLDMFCKNRGLNRGNIYARHIVKGWSLEKAINTPIKRYNKRPKSTIDDLI